MILDDLCGDELETLARELERRYQEHRAAGLDLDLTRGKPSAAQLELSAELDGILGGDYRLADGSDARGYGGLDGIAEAKALGAAWLGARDDEVIVGGNSSLALMHHYLLFAHLLGMQGPDSAWCRDAAGARFLCPVPGYDRHFAICEELGIDMIPVPMRDDGPDMDAVESLVGEPGVKGMWCVPKYANPTGVVYSDEVVRRIAALGRRASPSFRVLWDDAYAVHDILEPPAELLGVMDVARELGTEDHVVLFGSTSKVTFAGAGIAFMAASESNLAAFRAHLGVSTIGPDKVNQLRHVRFLGDMGRVREHMRAHAEMLAPKFECVQRHLEQGLAGRGMGEWTAPRGGYFVSFTTRPGLAKAVVAKAAGAGVKLTPAGAAFPYGRDPRDEHIRLAPTYPPLDEVDHAMAVFVTCVQLCSVEERLPRLAR